MACGFCSATKVDVCPICQTAGERKPPLQAPKVKVQVDGSVKSTFVPFTAPPAPATNPSALLADMLDAHKPAPVKASPPPMSSDAVIKEARAQWKSGNKNASVLLLSALAGGPMASVRKAIMYALDANGALRGTLSAADEALRLAILGDVTRELGLTCKAVPQTAAPVAVPAPVQVTPTAADLATARDMLANL